MVVPPQAPSDFRDAGGLAIVICVGYPGVIGFGGVTVREAVEWEALLPA